jgi:glycosyltransferase involved in cell wall biosynthesis
LNNFELLFAISHKTKELYSDRVDANSNLQVIYGGYEDHAFPLSSAENYLRSGVLCVASELHHKNVGRLIEAYALLPLELRKIHPLTIVGIKTSGARRRFLNLARNNECQIRVPKYVTKLELRQLYNQSRLLVVPSLSEGLSLPILEAWTEGLVVVGSSGTTIQEVLLWDQLLFNPEDSLSMAKVIQKFLDSNQLWLAAQKKSQERLQEFSWESTILLAENELRRLVNEA